MKEEERARITINDEAVCEVDVSASNLTIFLGLKGVQIDLQRDPYDLGAGLPRDVVKHWVTSSFRKGRLCGEWPKAYREDLGGFSPALIGNKVLAAYPALESLSAEGTEDLWAELMYAESDAMVQASTRLMQHSVPSLAVHDEMIVPVSQRELAERTISVRLQMVWDNLSCLGTEALARLGLRLGGFQLMFQSSLSDGVAFDPFSFQKDGSASAEVDVGRCQVL